LDLRVLFGCEHTQEIFPNPSAEGVRSHSPAHRAGFGVRPPKTSASILVKPRSKIGGRFPGFRNIASGIWADLSYDGIKQKV